MEGDIKDYHQVCSRHFPNADPRNKPELYISTCFATSRKSWTSRAKTAKALKVARLITPSLSSHHPVTPEISSLLSISDPQPAQVETPLVATAGEQFDSDYNIHELPTDDITSESGCSTLTPQYLALEMF